MSLKTAILLCSCVLVLLNCSPKTATALPPGQSPTLLATNPLAKARPDAVITLDAATLVARFPAVRWPAVKFMANGKPVPFQANDTDGDGRTDNYTLLLDFGAGEQKQINIQNLAPDEVAPTFEKRTQAEISHKVDGQWNGRKYEGGRFKNVDDLRVPPEHTDHSWYIRYEGPGWESDLVGYRFYLDWRNATDIFGKKTPDMVLQQVGQDGFDSYHEPAVWGMDVLKVGSSLGIGALGTWRGDKALRVETTDSLACRITENGPVESMVKTDYYGWKVGDKTTHVDSRMSIQAGSRLTRHDVKLTNSLPNICTGIVKHDQGALLTGGNATWGYIATWGQQSLNNDQLGMAILYHKSDLQTVTADAHSHVVVLAPTTQPITYYFLAAWELEPNGIRTQAAFQQYLNTVLDELASPIVVRF